MYCIYLGVSYEQDMADLAVWYSDRLSAYSKLLFSFRRFPKVNILVIQSKGLNIIVVVILSGQVLPMVVLSLIRRLSEYLWVVTYVYYLEVFCGGHVLKSPCFVSIISFLFA